jgi:hypothetical protein
MPVTVPLSVYRGDSYQWTFTLFTDEDGTVPYDLTGTIAESEIRAKSSSPVLATLDCVVTLPNVVDVILSAANSALLTGKLVWDLQLTTGELVRTVVAGEVTVTPDVTDSTRP